MLNNSTLNINDIFETLSGGLGKYGAKRHSFAIAVYPTAKQSFHSSPDA